MADLGTVGAGVLGGASMGAQLGSIAGPWGTAIGAVGGAIVGGVTSSNKQNAQDSALDRLEGIPSYDPMQLGFLDQLKKEKRAVESGFTTDFQVARDLNKEALAGGLSVAESVGATNPALAMSMSRQATRQYSTGINQALGTISTRGLGLTNSMGEMINKIAQRKLDLEMVKTSQQLGIATDALQTNQANMSQFAAKLPEQAGSISSAFGQIGSQVGELKRVAQWGNESQTGNIEDWQSTPMWQ